MLWFWFFLRLYLDFCFWFGLEREAGLERWADSSDLLKGIIVN